MHIFFGGSLFLDRNPRSREHIHSVMLNATFYVGISKLMAMLECSKSAAVLYAINEGLFKERVISEEDYELLKQRYGRKLKEVLSAGREDSHKPVLDREKSKVKQDLEHIDRVLKGRFEQWNLYDDNWKQKTFDLAEKYESDLQSARKILALRESESAI